MHRFCQRALNSTHHAFNLLRPTSFPQLATSARSTAFSPITALQARQLHFTASLQSSKHNQKEHIHSSHGKPQTRLPAALLNDSSDKDLIGNEGIEAIDPKDFPELYPNEGEVHGLSQESHPDDERAFEQHQGTRESESQSVLLSDKERSDEEFSWFVDEDYQESSSPQEDGGVERVGLSESDFVPLWQKNAQALHSDNRESYSTDSSPPESGLTVPALVSLLEIERARNVKVIDMREKCDWTDWMVICEGLSERHMSSIADNVYAALKRASPKTSPPAMEGRDSTDWIVIDAGTVVVHFMTPDARDERDLEGLWESVQNPLRIKDTEDLTWDDVKGKMTKSWKENKGRSLGEDGRRGMRGEQDIPLNEVVKW